jgi:hypothetical protein
MNAAGATTITVNTGLFAAGDTVFIQNLGAGACTVTAGTATVATAGSLILPQNDAGILYFTATGTAIFYDYIQAGAVSPLTTKGDVYTFSTSDARLGVGANGTVLTADSAEATGLKFATVSAGANWTLLNSGGTSLSGSTTTVSGISGADKIFILIEQASTTNQYSTLYVRLNGDTASNYYQFGQKFSGAANYAANIFDPENLNDTGVRFATVGTSATSLANGYFLLTGGNASGVKMFTVAAGILTGGGDQTAGRNQGGYYNSSSAITSVSLRTDSGTWDNGKMYVYTSA